MTRAFATPEEAARRDIPERYVETNEPAAVEDILMSLNGETWVVARAEGDWLVVDWTASESDL